MKRALTAMVLFACVVLASPNGLCADYNHAIINQSGQGLSSLFEGLKPSPFAKPDLLWTYRPTSGKWNGVLSTRLPGLLPVHIIGGSTCPSTEVCSGSFTVIVGSGGCTDPGCVVHNFSIDPSGDCFAGEQNAYCGDTCCVDAQDCFNRFGCGR